MMMNRLILLIFLLPLSTDGEDACDQELDVGHGKCYSKNPGPRYYFNYESGNCEVFDYLGCEGNENSFGTEDACLKACAYSHQEDDDEEELYEYGDAYVVDNGIVDDVHLPLFTGDKLSKGWFKENALIISKADIQGKNTSEHRNESALVPESMDKATLSTKIMSLKHHHLTMSFSFFMLDTSSSIKMKLEKFSDLSSTVDSTYKLFDSKHFRKIVKTKKDWINMRFSLHDSFDMKFGGRLIVKMKRSTNTSVLGLSSMNVTIVPLMSDKHYSINTGEEVAPPGFQGAVLTTLEIILIVALLLLAIFAIVLSYRHWSLRSHVKQYNLNNVSSTARANPVFSGNSSGQAQ